MDLETHAVPEPVAERRAQPGGVDQRPRSGVGVPPVHAGPDGREAGELRLEAERVELGEPLGTAPTANVLVQSEQ